MTPLRFYTARTLRNEPMLASLSVPQPALLDALADRQVALIGNARALTEGRHGPAIDAASLRGPGPPR